MMNSDISVMPDRRFILIGSLRLFAGVGVVLAVLQLLYVKIKERESLKYI